MPTRRTKVRTERWQSKSKGKSAEKMPKGAVAGSKATDLRGWTIWPASFGTTQHKTSQQLNPL